MYEEYYNLNTRPFQLYPDPRFYFDSVIHKRAMSYLRYGLAQQEGFIVITGEIGAGKTTVITTLICEHNREDLIISHLVATQLSADDTLRMVAAGFGLSVSGLDKATLLNRLEAFMTAHSREGKRLLLLVDEAQNLPEQSLEELRLLTNFQLDARGMLQVFLLGQPAFRLALQTRGLEQLRQRVISAYHLGPLDARLTRDYIEYRLAIAGWKGDPLFNDGAYALIYSFTDGIPRRTNILCDRLLLFGMLETVHQFDADAVATVIKEIESELVDGPSQTEANANNESHSGSTAIKQHRDKCVILRPRAEPPSDAETTSTTRTVARVAK